MLNLSSWSEYDDDEKNLWTCQELKPGCPAHSQSLYWLRYADWSYQSPTASGIQSQKCISIIKL
jgi:hypothetical protein